jgi:hypothetical protein
MTDRKTTDRKTGLTLFRRPDAGDVPAPWVPQELPDDAGGLPAPWVPPDLPASTGRAIAKPDGRTGELPAPWVPAELPPAPALESDDLGKLKPWVPPELPTANDAPRNLPVNVADDENRTPVEPQMRRRRKKQRHGGLTTETVQAGGQTTINIVNQVAAPASVYVAPWWGWWGGYGCPNFSCPRHAGRACWRVWCWHW